jgi:DNA-binding PadR family transcriptional regulator
MLLKGWVKADWGISETNRRVRFYQITAAGRKQLASEVEDYERVNSAIQHILRVS